MMGMENLMISLQYKQFVLDVPDSLSFFKLKQLNKRIPTPILCKKANALTRSKEALSLNCTLKSLGCLQ
jgi:hypothetical protein